MREKTFGYGRCIPADRNAKIRVKVYAEAYNARNRTGRQHKGPLTRATFEVLGALLWRFHNQHTGRCFPSYEAIADKAGCARSTVHLAIRALEAAGVLTWCNRLVRLGQRVFLTSNGYRFPPRSENPAGTNNQETQEVTSVRPGSFQLWRQKQGAQPPVRTPAEQIAILKGEIPWPDAV